jgi:hypothetical protein
MLLVGLVGCSSCTGGGTPKEEIDDGFWSGYVETDKNGEKYVRIVGITSEGIELVKENPEATIPETIGGYPVKVLSMGYYKRWHKDQIDSAYFGELKRLIIEPCVTVGENFFGRNKLDYIELKSEGKYVFDGDAFGDNSHTVMIAPENGIGQYVGRTFRKMANGCLVSHGVLYGYIGEAAELEVPNGITDLYTKGYFFVERQIAQIKLPASLSRIKAKNILSDMENLIIYVHDDTVIDKDAFHESVTIIRY